VHLVTTDMDVNEHEETILHITIGLK
jgi:hypothetical protein